MNSKLKIALATVVGVALGAAGMQGLHSPGQAESLPGHRIGCDRCRGPKSFWAARYERAEGGRRS